MARKLQPMEVSVPSKPFFVRIYVEWEDTNDQRIKFLRQETFQHGSDMLCLQDDYEVALQVAKRRTLLDGKRRWVEIEQCLKSASIDAEPGGTLPKVTWELKKKFMAVIQQHKEMNINAPTLHRVTGHGDEVRKLIERFGEDAPLEDFLTDDDREKRLNEKTRELMKERGLPKAKPTRKALADAVSSVIYNGGEGILNDEGVDEQVCDSMADEIIDEIGKLVTLDMQ
jgi:hypothetical protein